MRTIVVPTDFLVTSFNALESLKKITKKTDGAIYLVHILEHDINKYPNIYDSFKENVDNTYSNKLNSKFQTILSDQY